MFSYILVVSTLYILLISICPIFLYLQICLKITLGCKNMVAFYSTVQKFH